MAHTQAINEATPAGTDPVSSGDDQFRALKRDIRERMELEHYWNDSTADDDQKDGGHVNLTIKGTGVVANKELIKGSGYSLTGANAQSALDLAGTLNTSGAPAVIKADVVDTASGTLSRLIDLLVGGSSKFSVLKQGIARAFGLQFQDASELTIAAGAITVTQSYHRIDTEADAATDDLTDIVAGPGVTAGFVLVLRAENTARVVTVKDGGSLHIQGDYALSTTDRTLTLIYDGTNWRELARPGGGTFTVSLLDSDVSPATVGNTVTETSVYSVTVPGGTLGTNRKLRISLIGEVLNNSAGTTNFTVRIKFGATTIATLTSTGHAAGANARLLHVTAELSGRNATNAQAAIATMLLGTSTAGGITGSTSVGLTNTPQSNAHLSCAEDSTADKTLEITVQHGNADINISATIRTVHVERIGA